MTEDQLTRADLAGMTPEQINQARREGRLTNVMTGKGDIRKAAREHFRQLAASMGPEEFRNKYGYFTPEDVVGLYRVKLAQEANAAATAEQQEVLTAASKAAAAEIAAAHRDAAAVLRQVSSATTGDAA